MLLSVTPSILDLFLSINRPHFYIHIMLIVVGGVYGVNTGGFAGVQGVQASGHIAGN